MLFRECPFCGAALDPGEACDCQREPERKVVTVQDWEAAGDFGSCAKPGDAVEAEIVDSFVNCVPPVTLRSNLAQCGEPYSHRLDPRSGHWRATYTTFRREGSQWYYCGYCFAGDTVEPQHLTATSA